MSQDGTTNQGSQPRARAESVIAPFTVELGDNRNRTMSLDTLMLRPLRGRWSMSNLYGKNGGQSPGEVMSRMPDIPGLHVEVRPREKTVRIYDPLEGNAALLQQINDVLSDALAVKLSDQKIAPVPSVTHELDDDQLKTLMLELARKVHGKYQEARPVNGSKVPTVKEIEGFAGEELFDPWSNSIGKPRYVKDVPEWRDRLSRTTV